MMDQEEIKTTIEDIISNSTIGPMATVKNNKPYTRYMTFQSEGLKLYTLTHRETDKVEEIDVNPYTHILLGYEGEGFGDAYIEYEGRTQIKENNEWKKELWNDHMKIWFEGPEDPNLIVLEITPIEIKLMNKQGQPPETLKF